MNVTPEDDAARADAEQDAWDRLVAELPDGLRGGPPRVQFEALRACAPADLAPPSVRAGGRAAVAAHLDREAVRAVVRDRYAPTDVALADLRHEDLVASDDPGRALEEVHPRLFAGPLLTEAWCTRLLAEVDRLGGWARREGLPAVAPNSMNRHGVVLDDLGLAPAMRRLAREVLRPLAATRYPDLGGADLDDPHAFVVEYGDDADSHLDFHVDDSEVTLNLCLGARFEGGDLWFRGLRCDAHLQTGCSEADAYDHPHAPGRALLHAGKHRHGAHPLRAGRRVNLIVWCHSPSARASGGRGGCPAWCAESRAR